MNIKKFIACNKGFTVTEVAVAISLLSALAAYTLPDYFALVDKAKVVTCLTQKQAIQRIGEIYYIDHHGQQNVNFEVLIKEGYLETIPECQAGGKYYWQQDTRLLRCTIHDRVKLHSEGVLSSK